MNPLKEFFESGQPILWIETQNTVAFLRPVPDILVWTPCPASRLAEFLRLGKISLALTQLLLRALAVGDVDHGTHEFDEITCRAENRMSSGVNVPDGAIWMHEAVVRFKFYLHTDHPLHQFFQLGLRIAINPLKQFFESGQTVPWIETLNAVAFLRPILDTDFRTPCPASRLAEFLRICQIRFAAPDGFFRTLAFGDIHYSAHQFDKLSVLLDNISNGVQEFHRAVRHEHPMLEINLFSFRDAVKGLLPHLEVVRMDSLTNQLECRVD